MISSQWQLPPAESPPPEFVAQVRSLLDVPGHWASQLLWQRGIREPDHLEPFLQADRYQPTPSSAFGPELEWALERLQRARDRGERVAIWGDFDADGLTATAVLWEGLGQFFPQDLRLTYHIPHRQRDSHGLNPPGIDNLHQWGAHVIITCDTGSTDFDAIAYAQTLGIDVIVTDHHTLPDTRPPVVAILNPRYFAETHPLYHLSGVAVAYKLVEACYGRWPQDCRQPLENLLDLVAIGLIADLVALRGDCRYLAQKGIEQLKKQSNPQTCTRPGVGALLKLCRRTGDRPMDIGYGLGPRINAISRLRGDSHCCVTLLTSQDQKECDRLAQEAELSNSRRKEIQQRVFRQAEQQVQRLDLSTTGVIVLENPQWEGGVLGLVAGQLAQKYGRPTILLTHDGVMASGSARSIAGVNLYDLMAHQCHLLEKFGGHPQAAGLRLRREDLPLFTDAINQHLRQTLPSVDQLQPAIAIDLAVAVADLGSGLFRELKALEPYGMGNPVPRLLVRGCGFQGVRNHNIKDFKQNTIKYLRTTFTLVDPQSHEGFPGCWWGHGADEINEDWLYDVVVELDYNPRSQRYGVRLVDLHPQRCPDLEPLPPSSLPQLWDWRSPTQDPSPPERSPEVLPLTENPPHWDTLQRHYRTAQEQQQDLALAYGPPSVEPWQQAWERFMAMAQHYYRQHQTPHRSQWQRALQWGDRSFNLGLELLAAAGLRGECQGDRLRFIPQPAQPVAMLQTQLQQWAIVFGEERFHQQYFALAAVKTLAHHLQHPPSLVETGESRAENEGA